VLQKGMSDLEHPAIGGLRDASISRFVLRSPGSAVKSRTLSTRSCANSQPKATHVSPVSSRLTASHRYDVQSKLVCLIVSPNFSWSAHHYVQWMG
jgi:hypothetical protein